VHGYLLPSPLLQAVSALPLTLAAAATCPPHQQASRGCTTALFSTPSTNTSSRGLASSTTAPRRCAARRQSVEVLPSPQEAQPWGSLLRSAANTFQQSLYLRAAPGVVVSLQVLNGSQCRHPRPCCTALLGPHPSYPLLHHTHTAPTAACCLNLPAPLCARCGPSTITTPCTPPT
jgi:hypothetical protein